MLTRCDIVTADRNSLKTLGIGDVLIYLPNGDKKTKLMLKDIVHAPEMAFILISVRQLDHTNCTVVFKDGMCTIKNLTKCIMATIPHSNGLY